MSTTDSLILPPTNGRSRGVLRPMRDLFLNSYRHFFAQTDSCACHRFISVEISKTVDRGIKRGFAKPRKNEREKLLVKRKTTRDEERKQLKLNAGVHETNEGEASSSGLVGKGEGLHPTRK